MIGEPEEGQRVVEIRLVAEITIGADEDDEAAHRILNEVRGACDELAINLCEASRGITPAVVEEMHDEDRHGMDTAEVGMLSELIQHAADREIKRELQPASATGALGASAPSKTRIVEFTDGTMVAVSAVGGVVRFAINTPVELPEGYADSQPEHEPRVFDA